MRTLAPSIECQAMASEAFEHFCNWRCKSRLRLDEASQVGSRTLWKQLKLNYPTRRNFVRSHWTAIGVSVLWSCHVALEFRAFKAFFTAEVLKKEIKLKRAVKKTLKSSLLANENLFLPTSTFGRIQLSVKFCRNISENDTKRILCLFCVYSRKVATTWY